MTMCTVNGSIVALITPFHEDGGVNYRRLEELVQWHMENETDGIVALGTTAETPALTKEERDKIARTVIKTVNKRIPVIVGSGSNNTLAAREDSLKYEDMGADGLLIVTPYYNKTNKAGMVSHFTAIADAVSIPLIMYNVPGRTGCALSVEAVEILCRHPNIAGLKEASGDISYVSQVSRFADKSFAIYSGNDDMTVPILSLGGSGVISVLANILPWETHRLVTSYLDGNVERAREMQLRYLDFINALFIETNPIPIKEAMNQAGMQVGGYRLPLSPMEEQTRQHLIQTMEILKEEAS